MDIEKLKQKLETNIVLIKFESLKVNEKNASTIARRVEDIIAFGNNHHKCKK